MTAINFPDTPAADEEFTSAGRTFVWNDTLDVWESVSQDLLPDQTGESGNFLTTDGEDLSWSAVDALPSQDSQAGKYLTTDGTDASWSTIQEPDYSSDQAVIASQIFG
jgi:hypothetical protein